MKEKEENVNGNNGLGIRKEEDALWSPGVLLLLLLNDVEQLLIYHEQQQRQLCSGGWSQSMRFVGARDGVSLDVMTRLTNRAMMEGDL